MTPESVCVRKFLDLVMLLIPGGKERTENEYRTSFERAGFELTRIVPTATEVSIVEGKKPFSASEHTNAQSFSHFSKSLERNAVTLDSPHLSTPKAHAGSPSTKAQPR